MRRLLTITMALMTFLGISAAEKTAYVVWCADNATMYFTNREEALAEGDTFSPEGGGETVTITNLWSGEAVTSSGDNNPDWYGKSPVKAIIEPSFADVRPASTANWFRGGWSSKLETIEGMENLNTSEVTTMKGMFQSCSVLTSIDLSHFDTRKVTTMEWMFNGCNKLTSLDLSAFNTAEVTSMNCMFSNCFALEELNLKKFETDKVTDFYGMFSYCKNLTSLDLSNFKTSNVVSMGLMFARCSKLKSVNLSSFDTSKVVNMSYLFHQCDSLKTLDLSNFNTSNVTDMSKMFYQCKVLVSIDVSHFDVSKVTDLTEMFYECYKLTGNFDLRGWDTSKVKSVASMFEDCRKITGINMNGLNFNNCTAAQNMFYSCESMETLDLSGVDFSNVTEFYNFLTFCDSLKSVNMHGIRFSKLRSLNSLLSLDNLEEADLSDAQFDNAQTMSSMFAHCGNLRKVNMNGIYAPKLTNTSSMFYNCRELEELDITGLITPNVTNMNGMFAYCEKLKELDLSEFSTRKVTDMGSMFLGCTQLTSIYVSKGWHTSAVTSSNNMFNNCTSIVGEYGTPFDSEVYDVTNAHYDKGGYLRKRTEYDSPATYALWCKDNATLYFLHDKEILLAGGDFIPAGTTDTLEVSGLWKDERVTACPVDIAFNSAWRAEKGLKSSVTTVEFYPSFADVRPENTAYWFQNFSALTEIKGIEHLNTSEVTNMSSMFGGCQNLQSLDLSHFDTSNVYNMNYMFGWCKTLTSLDLSSFNTEKVINMGYMFFCCSSLEHIEFGDFNTGNVVDMGMMFDACVSLDSLDLSSFETDNVEYMNDMFANSGIHELNLSSFNTSKVKTMSSMFVRCGVRDLDLSSFDTSNVENMSDMFAHSSGITSLDLSSFNTSNVRLSYSMFLNCTNLQAVYVGEGWKTEGIEDSGEMFYMCSSLKGQYGACPPRLNTGGGDVYDSSNYDKTHANTNEDGYLRLKGVYVITLPESGIVTFSAAENVNLAPGINAFYGTAYDSEASTITATGISGMIVPAKTGVLLKGTPGETYILTATTDEAASASETNLLKEMVIGWMLYPTDGQNTYFTLDNDRFTIVEEFVIDPTSTVDMETMIIPMEPCNSAFLPIANESVSDGSKTNGITILWEKEPQLAGDVNLDGTVDISDVVAVINTMAGSDTFKATSDVNNDGKTDISDVVNIINIIAGGF